MKLPDLGREAFDHYRRGDFKSAEQIARRALLTAPRDPNLLQFLAAVLVAQHRADEAVSLLEKAIDKSSATGELLYNLGTALAVAGRHKEAAQRLEQACGITPQNPDYHNNLGLALLATRRYVDAEAAFKRSLELRPNWPVAFYNIGRAAGLQARHQDALDHYARAVGGSKGVPAELMVDMGYSFHQLGRYQEALASYDRAVSLKPNYAEAYNDRGNTLLSLHRPAEALASYDRALALKPNFAEFQNNRGNALIQMRRQAEALASYDRAIVLKPNYAEAHNGRGIALCNLGRPAEALASYDRAIALKPDYADAYQCRGNLLNDLGRLNEALESYGCAIAIKPEASASLAAYVHVALGLCDWPAAESARTALLESCRTPAFNGACFPVLAISEDLGVQQAAAQNFVRNNVSLTSAPTRTNAPPRPNKASGDGKIRLGYLSPDFRNHPTAYLIAELIEVHDRDRFDILGFSVGDDDRSAMRQRLSRSFDVFVDASRMSDDQLVGAIRQAQIDILVDLGGHTHGSRIMALAGRPAPVQVTYLGYPGTTGAPFIEYAIVDKFVIADGADRYFTEKLAYLPDCYQVNDRKRSISERTPSRAECGLPEGVFVYCCFNHPNKIGPQVFDVWMRVLAAVPNSVLWLLQSNTWVPENLRREARARGVNPERLVFAPMMGLPDHLARLGLADLFLDTWPYNAHTTASDALWVGLPLLTYSGKSFAARVAGSLLHAIGMPELVTRSVGDYEARALELATSPEAIRVLTQKLRANIATAPLFDTDRFRRHIEAAFVHMWDRYRRGETPESFAVTDIQR
jgi:protein O-GlcNAc transferase